MSEPTSRVIIGSRARSRSLRSSSSLATFCLRLKVRSSRVRAAAIASLRAGVCALGLGDPHGAEQHLRRASESDPTQWQPLYRLACAESQQGDVEAALGALEAAAAKGFADVSTLQRDACLRPLAAEPRFQILVRTLGGGAQR